MTDERDISIEDENPHPAEVEDDGLGESKPVPVDPAEVGEDDGSTVEHHEDE